MACELMILEYVSLKGEIVEFL